MKKSLLFILLTATVFSINAQITINRSHLISSGQIAIQAFDTNSFNVQTGGTNKTWNFSTLKSMENDTMKFNPPQWYAGASYFPNANLAIRSSSSGDSSFTFLKLDNSELSFEGIYDIFPDTAMASPFKRTMLTLPSTYNTSFTRNNVTPIDAFELGFDPDSTGPIPFIDSIRISSDSKMQSTIIGWGSLTTPVGTYNVLMQGVTDINSVKLEMYTNNIWLTVPTVLADLLGFGSIPSDTSYQHVFWANDASVGFPLVSYDYSPGNSTTNSVSWLVTKLNTNGISDISASSAHSIYPNPCHSVFNVKLEEGQNALMNILDMNGKLVKSLNVSNGSTVDIAELANGIYTVSYRNTTDGSAVANVRLVKF